VGRTASIGARVSFRKWGKLEAAARPAGLTLDRAPALAKADAAVVALLAATPLPHRLQDGATIAWNRAKATLAARGASASSFDAFVIECVSETAHDCVFTFSVKPAVSSGRYFQRHFTLRPGYNCIEFDCAEIRADVDLEAPVLAQIEPVNAPEVNSFVFGTLEFVVFKPGRRASVSTQTDSQPTARAEEASKPAPLVKCVVWDLDNTLWRGTLIEDGVEKLELNPAAVNAIVELDQRGILHSIASKNNARDALAALDRFGLRDYFLAPQINWGPKSASIDEISRRLNIHKNTFLFIDDQAFERAEVAYAHPDVRVMEEACIHDLLDLPAVDVPVTAEAKSRRQMYQVEETRESAFRSADTSFQEFLRSCDLKLTIGNVVEDNIHRVFELAQRTNQLNYAGRASSRKDIEDLFTGAVPDTKGLVLSCSDRFGDYGVIGFAVVNLDRFHVENFFMSCRVQHKKVDHAFFGWLLSQAQKIGRDRVTTTFRFSGRNEAARQVLKEMKFTASNEADVYISPRLVELPERDLVTVIDHTESRAELTTIAAN
jgi:FkbH-like protein